MRFGLKLVVPVVMLSLSAAKVDYAAWTKPIFFFFVSSLTLARAAAARGAPQRVQRLPLVPWRRPPCAAPALTREARSGRAAGELGAPSAEDAHHRQE
jgi:hypothetical protein